jgi:hypothetical protein
VKPWLHIVIVLFVALLWLPLTQTVFRWLPEAALAGVEKVPPAPESRLSAWWDGSLQTGFDPWFNAKVGLRGWMVRTYNQIQYSVFGTFAGSGTKVVKGRQGMLFEKVYVDAFQSPRKRTEKELRDVCGGVRELQDRLAARGTAFLLVIAPSKAEILSEYLPGGIDVKGRGGKRSARDDMAALLDEYGIHHLDAHELFKAWKAEGAPPLFSNGGTHWNHYAAARVAGLMLEALRGQTKAPMPSLRVTGAVTNGVIWGADNDLGDLLNLWTSRRMAGPQVHPVLEKTASDPLPDILFVGDSFVLTLTRVMDEAGLYRKRDTLYYFNRRYSYPGKGDAPLDRGKADVAAELEGRDAVIIEINEYWLPRIGFGFVKAALKALADQNSSFKDSTGRVE